MDDLVVPFGFFHLLEVTDVWGTSSLEILPSLPPFTFVLLFSCWLEQFHQTYPKLQEPSDHRKGSHMAPTLPGI